MDVPDWLAHLRTDRRGIPVPWINHWGPEDPGRVTVAWDRNVNMPGLFIDDTGHDVPDFTRQNMGRQRHAMTAGLCQVCGRFVPWSRRRIVVADLSVEAIDWRGRRVPVVVEPWLDERCATFAVQKCPALIRRDRADDLRVVEVTSRSDVAQFVSVGWVEGQLEESTRADPPAMWVKLALVGAGMPRLVST